MFDISKVNNGWTVVEMSPPPMGVGEPDKKITVFEKPSELREYVESAMEFFVAEHEGIPVDEGEDSG